MQIKAGYTLRYECPQPTPMLLMLNIPLIGENDWTRSAEARVRVLLQEISDLKDKVHEVVASGERRPALDTPPEIAA